MQWKGGTRNHRPPKCKHGLGNCHCLNFAILPTIASKGNIQESLATFRQCCCNCSGIRRTVAADKAVSHVDIEAVHNLAGRIVGAEFHCVITAAGDRHFGDENMPASHNVQRIPRSMDGHPLDSQALGVRGQDREPARRHAKSSGAGRVRVPDCPDDTRMSKRPDMELQPLRICWTKTLRRVSSASPLLHDCAAQLSFPLFSRTSRRRFYPRRIPGKSKIRILIQRVEMAISTPWIPTRR